MKYSLKQRALSLGLTAAFGLGIFGAATAASAGPDGAQIMQKVSETKMLDGSEALVKMSVTGKEVRSLSMATKLYDGGKTEKRIIRFLSPSDVKGTGVLIYDYADKADDVWLYMSAMKKTRRIVGSQRSQSFMGSEFNFGDFSAPELDQFSYKILKEESAGGEACTVIEVLPKDKATGEAEGYSKKVFWVGKTNNTIRKGEFYDMGGELLKVLTTSDIKLVDPAKKRYRAMKLDMENKKNGRKSTFETEKIALSPNAKDEYFTTSYLENP
jgi:Outer membrane lipoprotein-sorting protein